MRSKILIALLGFGCLFLLGLILGRYLTPASPQFSFASPRETTLIAEEEKEERTSPFSLESSFRSISKSLLPAVIEIHGKGVARMSGIPFFFGFDFRGSREQEWAGSGVIVLKDEKRYYALTNNHVIENASALEVKVYGSDSYAKAEVKGRDSKRDLALISFDIDSVSTGVKIAPLGDSDKLEVGDIVLAIGSPLEYSFTVTQGIISALLRSVNPRLASRNSFIQTDAAINQGNSGGPLVNLLGEVVGINTAIATPSGGSVGLGFAIPVNDAKTAIERFLKGEEGDPGSGWLGVLSSVYLDSQMMDSLGIAQNQKGAFIMALVEGSPADKGGLQAGDYVTYVNGQSISSGSDLTSYLSDFYSGEKISIKLIRQGKEVEADLILSTRPDEKKMEGQKYFPFFTVYPVTEEIKQYFGIQKSWIQGVIITSLLSKKLGMDWDIHQNDLITHINGKVISSMMDFYEVLNEGTSFLELSLWRRGIKKDVKIRR